MNLENRSPHYEEVKVTATVAVVAGVLATHGVINAFPQVSISTEDIADGKADYAPVMKSSKVIAKKAVGAIAVGAVVYYDESAGNVTTIATDNILIGTANKSALSADTEISINFDGTLAYAKA